MGKLRIKEIEGVTGLRGIKEAFENRLNETDVELIVSFLARKYKFSEVYDDIYEFIVDTVGISVSVLNDINANYEEFYDNLNIYEAMTIILNKILLHSNEDSKNGFPAEFNFDRSKKGVQNYNGKLWYPIFNDRANTNHNELLVRVLRN